MIITTLAARAYRGEPDVASALTAIMERGRLRYVRDHPEAAGTMVHPKPSEPSRELRGPLE